MKRWFLIGAFLLCAAQARAAEGPSFSCAKASTEVERAICASPELSALDRKLDAVYRAALVANESNRATIVKDQRDNAKMGANHCAGTGPVGSDALRWCVRNELRDQIAVLEARAAAAAPGTVCDRIERAVRAAGPTRFWPIGLIRMDGAPLTWLAEKKLPKKEFDALGLPEDATYGEPRAVRFGSSPYVAVMERTSYCYYGRVFRLQPGQKAVELPPLYQTDEDEVCMDYNGAPTLGPDGTPIYVEQTSDSTLTLTAIRDGKWERMCRFVRTMKYRWAPAERSCGDDKKLCDALERFAGDWLDGKRPRVRMLDAAKDLENQPKLGDLAASLQLEGFVYSWPMDDELFEVKLAGAKRIIMAARPMLGSRDGEDYVFSVLGKDGVATAALRMRNDPYAVGSVTRSDTE